MKSIITVFALALCLPPAIVADTSVLLVGNIRKAESGIMSVSDGAKAVIKEGTTETKVTASEILFDSSRNVLISRGESSVTFGGHVLKGKDLTIEFGGQARVFVASSASSILFMERFPSVDLDLKSLTRR